MKKNKKLKTGDIFLIAIEYLWLAMGVFTLIAGIIKINKDGFEQLFGWVFIVLSIMCVFMFFVRRHTRKQKRR